MFLLEKYRPKKPKDFMFNQEILQQLVHIAANDDIPHIIISGPSGGGKKTLVKFFLEALYGYDVNNLEKRKYQINGSSTKKKIKIMQSNYHIIIEPTGTNHDKYILQEIIKQYAMYKPFQFNSSRKFKTIIIHNIENLANNSQAALRRTMELYAKTCRFVMLCNNLSKVFDPLRSRCRTFCVPLPTPEQIEKIILYISIMERMKLSRKQLKNILVSCGNNLKNAIWMLDVKRLNCGSKIALEEVFEEIIELILSCRKSNNIIKIFDEKIRKKIYDILITNIKGSDIIIILLDKLIMEIDDDVINSKIIQYASTAEHNLNQGRRDIIQIDYFITGVIRELIISS